MGSLGKLEHRCTTTNLPLCNDTIIVLKLILLHSVSIITNFIIPKRDKKQTDKKTSHFFVYSRRATRVARFLAAKYGRLLARTIFASLTILYAEAYSDGGYIGVYTPPPKKNQ